MSHEVMHQPPRDLIEGFRSRRLREGLRSVGERQKLLRALKHHILERQDALFTALRADFGKSPHETEITELQTTLGELETAIRSVKHWARPVRVPTPWHLFGSRSEIHYEPKGTVLVLSPWNYPFYLCMVPLISAIAAGNDVVVKPSEKTPRTSEFIRDLVAAAFPHGEARVLLGDHTLANALTALPFDHIFFTGSGRVGRMVMGAAAKNLVPVTLELGGKSPAYVDPSANISEAARRIAWGKFVNAGQTCVAPDYVLVPKEQEALFLGAFRQAVEALYGADEIARRGSSDYCRIIDAAALARLRGLYDESVRQGAQTEFGGVIDADTRYFAPTLLRNVTPAMPIMQEEIFGPILPVIAYANPSEAVELILSRDKPLAFYLFAEDRDRIDAVLNAVSAGGVCVNNTLIHLSDHGLPFGGVGESGMGNYHGHHGFVTFSHAKSVLRQGPLNAIRLFSAPYAGKESRIRWLTRFFARIWR